MSIKIKAQRDYLLTEASMEPGSDVSQVDEILRTSKADGRMVVLYNGGAVQGINIEQRSKIPESKTANVRSMIGVDDKKI
jgi:hypothetical protein